VIEPQIHNAQPGSIGQQHGLQRLTSTLEALRADQQAQQTRDAQMQTQLTIQALGALDATLAQQWSTLPKGTQEALTTAYRKAGLVPPGQRK
jgi:hypothetical protein